jgi:hypothetical protein
VGVLLWQGDEPKAPEAYVWQGWSKRRVLLAALTAARPFSSRSRLPVSLTLARIAERRRGIIARWIELQAWWRLLGLMVDTDPNGGLASSDHYGGLDGDARKPYSEALGRAMAKIVAEDHLGVPFLVRAEDLRARLTKHGEGIADLIGPDDNDTWHVIEAKGYSIKTVQKGKLKEAINQARTVATVNGEPPKCSGCVTATLATPFEVGLVDPQPKRKGARLGITTGDLVVSHYELLAGLIVAGPFEAVAVTVGSYEFMALPLDNDVLLGLRSDVAEAIVESGLGLTEPSRAVKKRLGDTVYGLLRSAPWPRAADERFITSEPSLAPELVIGRDGIALIPYRRFGG